MGGKVLEYEEKDILRRGIKQGLEKGREEGLEEGLEKGLEKGLKKGAEESQLSLVQTMLRKGKSPVLINEFTDIPISYITNVQSQMKVMEES